MQSACIPPILGGQNVIGAAETGTGKTAAFVLPILQTLAEDPYGVYAVIVTPTRELAFQISQQISALGVKIAVRQHVLVGGIQELAQAAALEKRPHIVVATPGRMALMIRKGYVDLSRVRYVVLDEADRLLDAAYLGDLKSILGACTSEKRQMLLFSATMTSSIEALQRVAMEDESVFRFDARENRFATVDCLKQTYIFTPAHMKECHLVNLLKEEFSKENVIVFVGRCETAELLVTMLNMMGMKKVAALHSDMSQTTRIQALHQFKSQTIRALIATDVASRGLDIPACEVVINYDIPRHIATYVHRVGRTARAGRDGRAISFVSGSDVELVHAIEERIERKLDTHEGRNEKEVMKLLNVTLKARQLARMQLHDNGFMDKTEERRKEARGNAKKRRRHAQRAERAKRVREEKEGV